METPERPRIIDEIMASADARMDARRVAIPISLDDLKSVLETWPNEGKQVFEVNGRLLDISKGPAKKKIDPALELKDASLWRAWNTEAKHEVRGLDLVRVETGWVIAGSLEDLMAGLHYEFAKDFRLDVPAIVDAHPPRATFMKTAGQ